MTPAQEIERRNNLGRERLSSALKSGHALLMAGAGCGVDIGYPDLDTLIKNMTTEITPGLSIQLDDVKLAAQAIWAECVKRHKDSKPFERYLYDKFSPKLPAYSDFHCDLVKLPFAGYATTNYDSVLEDAIRSAFSEEYSGCETVNMCTEATRHLVLDFFRALSSGKSTRRRVLHIHGTYDHPSKIVLTQNDYERFYNGAIPKEDGTMEKSGLPDTFHRKAIWSLLASYTMVFVGFSLRDSFFLDIINVWRKDFDLKGERPHIAIMDYNSTDDIRAKDEQLAALGVVPLYYEVPADNPSNHSGLKSLVAEIAEQCGVRPSQPSVNELTKRNLGLIK